MRRHDAHDDSRAPQVWKPVEESTDVSGTYRAPLPLVGFGLIIAAAAFVAISHDTRSGSYSIGAPAGAVINIGERASHNRRYVAKIINAPDIRPGTPQTWMLHVRGRNHRRIAAATIVGRVSMPETGEVAPGRLRARYVGHGNYELAGIAFSRPGCWNIVLVVDGVAGTDSVVFNVILPAG